MPRGASQTEIVNLALSNLGCKPIEIITDPGSVEAVAANRVWNSSLRATLSALRWPFATSITPLLSIDYEAIGWSFAYAYPVNAVRIWLVYNKWTKDTAIGEKFREVYDPTTNGNIILTNCEDAYAEATYWVTDTTLYDPTFTKALGYQLASELAIALTGREDLQKQMSEFFRGSISEASRLASYGNMQTPNQSSSMLDARR